MWRDIERRKQVDSMIIPTLKAQKYLICQSNKQETSTIAKLLHIAKIFERTKLNFNINHNTVGFIYGERKPLTSNGMMA